MRPAVRSFPLRLFVWMPSCFVVVVVRLSFPYFLVVCQFSFVFLFVSVCVLCAACRAPWPVSVALGLAMI